MKAIKELIQSQLEHIQIEMKSLDKESLNYVERYFYLKGRKDSLSYLIQDLKGYKFYE